MSKNWVISKRSEFVRDVFRDFCFVNRALDLHFQEYDRTGEISFDFFKDILGQEMNKGLLWRLKDTAHLLFRTSPQDVLVERFLDWGIGYIFHESMKLKEDAYQRQNYGPWFLELEGSDRLLGEERLVNKEFFQVIQQTRQSIEREVGRVRFILFHCRRLLVVFLANHGRNLHLARFIYDNSELVSTVFRGGYDDLLAAIYRNRTEQLYLLAAQALRQGGWMQDAAAAVDQAQRVAPREEAVLQEKKIIDKWKNSIRKHP